MKKFISLVLSVIFTTYAYTQQNEASNVIELVESVPIGTTLDNADIRNTTEVWLEMISNGKKTLDIEQFYISNKKGEPLEVVINAIIDAAKRGLKVRIIADSKMYKTYPETIDSLGKMYNISKRIIDFGNLKGGVQHAKYFIVDEEEIFLGSQNFDWRALKHIHELGIRIKHKHLVKIYQDIFNLDWQLAEKNSEDLIPEILKVTKYRLPYNIILPTGDTATLYPTASPIGLIPDSSLWDETHILNLINSAKSEIFCQFLTYSPISRTKYYYETLDNAFRRAATKGVKVKMIVSDWSKEHPIVDHLKSLSLVPNVDIKFSVIPEWIEGYIPYARVAHCKFIVVDGKVCWIGTSNAEKSYFYTSRNLGIVVHNKAISEKLRSVFLKSWNSEYAELVRPEIEYTPREHTER